MTASAAKLIELAKTRIGCRYVMGADVPLTDAAYHGDFDCAEFASWLAYQITGELVGCTPAQNPDPYSGRWYDETNVAQSLVPGGPGPIPVAGSLRRATVADAMRIPGAVLIRRPQTGAYGHVAIKIENDDSIEAYSSAPYPEGGVRVVGGASRRRWDIAALLPNVAYERVAADTVPKLTPPRGILRKGSTGTSVRELQTALRAKGFMVDVDGGFGNETLKAVVAFQKSVGLVPDGEVGGFTWAKLLQA